VWYTLTLNVVTILQAAIYLHEEDAKYPKKINYNFTPPHLSLEALEVSFHAFLFFIPLNNNCLCLLPTLDCQLNIE
jgi:hypothetical protein